MIDILKLSVTPNQTIRQAMQKINEVSVGFALVLDEAQQLVGVISDGDIRRSILKGENLESPLANVMNKTPTFLAEASGIDEQAKKLITEKLLQGIPIVDRNKKVLRVVLRREMDLAAGQTFDNPIVIMAGGRGSRLGELTENCPKPLLPIDGVPLLERSIKNFAKQGFKNIFVSLNYRSDMIQSHLKDGSQWGVKLQYLCEEIPLGTAGALHLLPELKENLPLIVINGDVLTSVHFTDLLEYHQINGYSATMCVRSYDFQVPFGVVNVNDNRIQDVQEKPSFTQLINAGVYVVNPDVLKQVPKNSFYNMTTMFQDCLEQARSLGAYVINGYWIDIGHKEDLHRAQEDIRKYNL
jgi:dTDP-glucose pyrophosphorylase